MSRSVTQPPDVVDVFSAQGDLVIGHTREAAREYRDQAARLMQERAAGVPRGQQAAPAVPQLPMLGVARQHWGKEIHALALRAESLRRQVEAQPAPANGNHYGWEATSALLNADRDQAREGLKAVEAEIRRLESLDDRAVQVWARDEKGAR